MYRIAAALLALAAIGSCAHGAPRETSRGGPERMLCVQDNTAGYGTLTIRTDHGLIFHPWPGERVCKRTTVPTRMSVTSIGGGLAGPLRGTMTFVRTDAPCMVWRLRGVRDAEVDFVPCTWE